MFLVALKKADENRVHMTPGAAPGLAKEDVPNGEANTHKGDQTDRQTAWHNSKGKKKTGQDTGLGKAGPLFALNHKGGEDEVSSTPVHTAQATP